MPFVLKTHRNAIAVKCPQLLDKPIIQFAGPLSSQEFNDCNAPFEELRAITPVAIFAVCPGDRLWVAAVPGVFGGSHFGDGSFEGERRTYCAPRRLVWSSCLRLSSRR